MNTISIDTKIKSKKAEIEALTRMLENAKKDLRLLEELKKKEGKKL